MFLSDLNYEDRFYVDGKKWSQFIRIKKPIGKKYYICCISWPMCKTVKMFMSDTQVKLIIK
jgi:hypothetical protein